MTALAVRQGGTFSVSLQNVPSFYCVECGKAIDEDNKLLAEEDQSSTVSSGKNSDLILDENSTSDDSSKTVFDKLPTTKASRLTLEVEEQNTEWRRKKPTPKHYTLEYLENEKTILVDFSELSSAEINKPLLNNIYTLAGHLQAEALLISVSLLDPEKNSIIRNLLVFGFERVQDEKFTSDDEVTVLRMEVNQEDDFVDLI